MRKNTGRILISDDSLSFTKRLKNTLVLEDFEVLIANDGQECLQMIDQYRPDLIFLGLMTPKVHGIDILRKLREESETEKTGVIISTTRALIQDYDAAIQNGADYYLIKPFEQDVAISLAKKFFLGELKPIPFQDPLQNQLDPKDYYNPSTHTSTNYIKFWGTRGSVPVAGLEYYRYGGNTSCLEIRSQSDLVIIDAGSGIRNLGSEILNSEIRDIHLFISHSHWDHIMGFPFFPPVYSDQFNIHIYAARGFKKNIEELFTGMLDHDYFPVRLDEMHANFSFYDLQTIPSVIIGNIKIDYTFASHPGTTLCFKITHNNKSYGYATDNEILIGYHGHPNEITKGHPLLENYQSIIDFYQDCDTLIHEAQFSPQDYLNRVGWGHSSISNAAVLTKLTNAKEWIVTHHDPSHTDLILLEKIKLHKQILSDCDSDCLVYMAYDGFAMAMH